MPKRVKHRKVQRGNNAGLSQRCNKLDFGEFGLQTLERTFLTANQIEAARVAITRHMQRRGKYGSELFPTSPIRRSLLRCVWVKVRVNVEFWVARFSLAVCFLKSRVVRRR